MKTSTKIYAAFTAVIGIIGPVIAPALIQFVQAHVQGVLGAATVAFVAALFHNPAKTA